MIIAIDGPAGAGKSTVAKLLAKKLGFLYIDTGAMYRALTVKALEKGIDPKDEAALGLLAASTVIDLVARGDAPLQVLLDGRDVSVDIRQPRVTAHVSDVAKVKAVRQVMLGVQRRLGASRDSVMDGRDIGTVVFPDAQRKFFIDASFDERVNRRLKDMRQMGNRQISAEAVAADLKNRDTIDSTREHAPLKRAADAVYIDTTSMTIDEVVAAMAGHVGRTS